MDSRPAHRAGGRPRGPPGLGTRLADRLTKAEQDGPRPVNTKRYVRVPVGLLDTCMAARGVTTERLAARAALSPKTIRAALRGKPITWMTFRKLDGTLGLLPIPAPGATRCACTGTSSRARCGAVSSSRPGSTSSRRRRLAGLLAVSRTRGGAGSNRPARARDGLTARTGVTLGLLRRAAAYSH